MNFKEKAMSTIAIVGLAVILSAVSTMYHRSDLVMDRAVGYIDEGKGVVTFNSGWDTHKVLVSWMTDYPARAENILTSYVNDAQVVIVYKPLTVTK